MRTPKMQRTLFRVNMTPMIDVVFLLLIFFLVFSNLTGEEVDSENITLAVAKIGQPPQDSGNTVLTVNLLADGTIKISGSRVTLDQVKQQIADIRQKTGTPLEVHIRGDAKVSYQFVDPVLQICKDAGLDRFDFPVRQGDK